MLLSDPRVETFLRDEVVPCWIGVRDVPKVTIDFGGGQVLHRTLAGNTVIHLCDRDGRVIDSFPGVYTPGDFLTEIRPAMDLLHRGGKETGPAALRAWHAQRFEAGVATEVQLITRAKVYMESPLLAALGRGRNPLQLPPAASPVTASLAADPATLAPIALPEASPAPPSASVPISASKAAVEVPLRTLLSSASPIAGSTLPLAPADPAAMFRAACVRLVDLSKLPLPAFRLRAARGNSGAPLSAEELGRRIVVEDSRNNLRVIRPLVHLLLSTYDAPPLPVECRTAFFEELLHVPISDPWLGLRDVVLPGTPE